MKLTEGDVLAFYAGGPILLGTYTGNTSDSLIDVKDCMLLIPAPTPQGKTAYGYTELPTNSKVATISVHQFMYYHKAEDGTDLKMAYDQGMMEIRAKNAGIIMPGNFNLPQNIEEQLKGRA